MKTGIDMDVGYMLFVKNYNRGGYVIEEVQLYDMISYQGIQNYWAGTTPWIVIDSVAYFNISRFVILMWLIMYTNCIIMYWGYAERSAWMVDS